MGTLRNALLDLDAVGLKEAIGGLLFPKPKLAIEPEDVPTVLGYHSRTMNDGLRLAPLPDISEASPAQPAAIVTPAEPDSREIEYVGLGDKIAVVEIERPYGHSTDVPLPLEAFNVKMVSL